MEVQSGTKVCEQLTEDHKQNIAAIISYSATTMK